MHSKKNHLLWRGGFFLFGSGLALIIGVVLVGVILGAITFLQLPQAQSNNDLPQNQFAVLRPTPTPMPTFTASIAQPAPAVSARDAVVSSGTPLPSPVKRPAPPKSTGAETDTTATLVPRQQRPVAASPTPNASHGATAASVPVSTPTPSPEQVQSATPTPTVTPSPTPSATVTHEPTLSSPARISGRILLGGVPPGADVVLGLEDQTYNRVAEITVGADGAFTFSNVPASDSGYNVVFSQKANPQYQIEQVISWGWLGPISLTAGEIIELPDFDISLLGFGQTAPAPNATFSAANISAAAPIVFEWNAYPQASAYWVDLTQGEEQNVFWQSPAVQLNRYSFDGAVANGQRIQPGEYWWGVGAIRQLGPYKLTVYGYLPVFYIEP